MNMLIKMVDVPAHTCVNMVGTYRCECPYGYTLLPNKRDCVRRGEHTCNKLTTNWATLTLKVAIILVTFSGLVYNYILTCYLILHYVTMQSHKYIHTNTPTGVKTSCQNGYQLDSM